MPTTTTQSVSLVKGTVPQSACFSSVDELYNLFINITTAHVDGAYSLFNYGPTEPSASDRDKPWVRTDGGYLDRIYTFQSGFWTAPHPVPPKSSERRIWTGTLDDLKAYDGGDGTENNGDPTTGSFWEVDDALSGRFPLGVGRLDSGLDVDANGTGGSEEVLLESSNIPEHQHDGKAYYRAVAGQGESEDPSGLGDITLHENSGHTTNGSYNQWNVAGVRTTEIVGDSGEAHDNMPPYYGVYFIKRTKRIYYTV